MPLIIERCLNLDIRSFGNTSWNTPDFYQSGIMRWGNELTISFSVTVNNNASTIKLMFQYDGKRTEQVILLRRVVSNLGKGFYWVMICPVTQKPCKRLYFSKGTFKHRTAIKGMMYEKQAEKPKGLYRYMYAYFAIETLYEHCESPYFREYYAGKITRRTLRMVRKLEKLKPMIGDLSGLKILLSKE